MPMSGVTFSLVRAHLPQKGSEPGSRSVHRGFDFVDGYAGRSLNEREPVVAIAGGRVVKIAKSHLVSAIADESGPPSSRRSGMHEPQVWLEHDGGLWSRYGNLESISEALKPGGLVRRGELLGFAGKIRPDHLARDEDVGRSALHFELGLRAGAPFLGHSEQVLEIHDTLARLFGMDALPRYARMRVRLDRAGRQIDSPYPPESLSRSRFGLNLPASLPAGAASAIPVSWAGDSFRVEDFFATVDTRPARFVAAANGAWLLACLPGAVPAGTVELTVGAVDRFGQTMIGSRTLRVEEIEGVLEASRVPEAVVGLYSPENIELEKKTLRSIMNESGLHHEPLWTEPFVQPLQGDVIRQFGQPVELGTGPLGEGHPGFNTVPDAGRGVRATNTGSVIFASDMPIRGRTVVLDHGAGVISVYSHLERVTVTAGSVVPRGMAVGIAGSSGAVVRPQLRWELHCGGVPVDAQAWIGKLLPGRET